MDAEASHQVVDSEADTLIVSSELDRLVEAIKKQASEPGGERVCASVGCGTKLSRYNKTAVCSIHTAELSRAPHRW